MSGVVGGTTTDLEFRAVAEVAGVVPVLFLEFEGILVQTEMAPEHSTDFLNALFQEAPGSAVSRSADGTSRLSQGSQSVPSQNRQATLLAGESHFFEIHGLSPGANLYLQSLITCKRDFDVLPLVRFGQRGFCC